MPINVSHDTRQFLIDDGEHPPAFVDRYICDIVHIHAIGVRLTVLRTMAMGWGLIGGVYVLEVYQRASEGLGAPSSFGFDGWLQYKKHTINKHSHHSTWHGTRRRSDIINRWKVRWIGGWLMHQNWWSSQRKWKTKHRLEKEIGEETKRRRMAILVTDMFGTIVMLLSHCKLNVLEIKH